MTDANPPGGTAPGPDDAELETQDTQDAPGAGAERSRADVPGAPGNDDPMTDSTDGGLAGGEPGVEE